VGDPVLSYLTAHRYGLVKAAPTDAERKGGWRQVWAHPSGLRAARNPVTGRWQVSTGTEIQGEGFCSSLRAAAHKIERLTKAA
jgi:hypothetical protein